MSMMDYGAMLRKNGKFLNKNRFAFMSKSDTGYMLEEAIFPDGEKRLIHDNYFVYAGDEEFLLVFYKTILHVISHGKVLWSFGNTSLLSQTMHFEGLPSVTVAHLDKNPIPEDCSVDEELKDSLIEIFGKRRGEQKYLRICKKVNYYTRKYKTSGKYRGTGQLGPRYITTWNHNGNHYEVIFGYDITTDEKVWEIVRENRKDCCISEKEIEIIDDWFGFKSE